MKSKIIPFPKPIQDERLGDVLRSVLEQRFPNDTWRLIQFDRTAQLQARVLINRLLGHMDRGQRLKWLIQALPFKLSVSRKVAFDILTELKDHQVA